MIRFNTSFRILFLCLTIISTIAVANEISEINRDGNVDFKASKESIRFDCEPPYFPGGSPDDVLRGNHCDGASFLFSAQPGDSAEEIIGYNLEDGMGTINNNGQYEFPPVDTGCFPMYFPVTISATNNCDLTAYYSFTVELTVSAPLILNKIDSVEIAHCTTFVYPFSAINYDSCSDFDGFSVTSGFGTIINDSLYTSPIIGENCQDVVVSAFNTACGESSDSFVVCGECYPPVFSSDSLFLSVPYCETASSWITANKIVSCESLTYIASKGSVTPDGYYTFTASEPGITYASVIVTNTCDAKDTLYLVIDMQAPNPPIFISVPPQSVQAPHCEGWSFQFEADPFFACEGEVSFSSSSCAITSDGLLTIPPNSSGSPLPCIVYASTEYASTSYEFQVYLTNNNPDCSILCDLGFAQARLLYECELYLADPDICDNLTTTVSVVNGPKPIPSEMPVITDGVITWTPEDNDFGQWTFVVDVEDDQGAEDYCTFEVSVSPIYLFGEIEPVQVVFDCPTLVARKETLIKSEMYNFQSTPIKIMCEMSWDHYSQIYYDQGPSNQGITLQPGMNILYLPGGPVLDENGNTLISPWNTGASLQWETLGQDATSSISVVWDDWPGDPSSTSSFGDDLEIVNSNNNISIFYQNWRLPLSCGSDPGVSSTKFWNTAMMSSYFIISTFPLTELDWTGEPNSESHNCSSNPDDIVKDLKQLVKLLKPRKPAYNRIVGIASDEYFAYKWPNQIDRPNGVHATINANAAVIVMEDYYTVAAHELHHSYDGWRTGLLWPPWPWVQGGIEEYDVDPDSNHAFGFWITERDLINRKYDPVGAGLCFMGEKSSLSGDYKHYIQGGGDWDDYWICNECYDHLLTKFTNTSKISNDIVSSTILVSGSINKNNELNLEPMFFIDSTYATDVDSGNCMIQFYDESEVLLQENHFHIDFYVTTDPPGLVEIDTAYFAYTFPFPEDVKNSVKRISFNYNQTTQVDRVVSDNFPDVQVIYPDSGETLIAGMEYSLLWSGNDLDGDSLMYFVLLSPDMGESWNVIGLDIVDTTFQWTFPQSTNGNEFLVKITASDGVNTSSDLSNYPFAVESIYLCGDADASGAIDISDAVYLIAYIFSGGPAPDPIESGDADCSTAVDISDAVYLISYIFGGGPAPCEGCP